MDRPTKVGNDNQMAGIAWWGWLLIALFGLGLVLFNILLLRAALPSLRTLLTGGPNIEFMELPLLIASITLEAVVLVLALGGFFGFYGVTKEYEHVKDLRKESRAELERVEQRTEALRAEASELHEVLRKEKEDSERMRKEVDLRSRYGTAITLAISTLAPPMLPTSCKDQIADLESLLTELPLDRSLTILIGRLYWEGLGDLDTAIGVLSRYLFLAERKPDFSRVDIADVRYQRACYYALKREFPTCGEGERNTLEEKVKADMLFSIELRPENKLDAQQDPDLKSLRETAQWLKDLLAS